MAGLQNDNNPFVTQIRLGPAAVQLVPGPAGANGSGGPPSGAAGGDLTGTYPNPQVSTLSGTVGAVVAFVSAVAGGVGFGIGNAPGTDPTITRGTGVPATTQPNGSIFLRTDGSSSTGIYTRQSGVWSAISGGGGGGSVTWANDLAGNGTTTSTNQYVSAISFSSAAGGGSIAVNGTNTLLNWVSNAIQLQQNAVTLVQLKALSSDFISLGATAASSGLLRASNALTALAARNAANSTDLGLVGSDASNNLVLGDAANVANVLLEPKSGGLISIRDASTEYANFQLISSVATLTAASTAAGLTFTQSTTSNTTAGDTLVMPQASSNTNGSPGSFRVTLQQPTGTGSWPIFRVNQISSGTQLMLQAAVGQNTPTVAYLHFANPGQITTPDNTNFMLGMQSGTFQLNVPFTNLWLLFGGGIANGMVNWAPAGPTFFNSVTNDLGGGSGVMGIGKANTEPTALSSGSGNLIMWANNYLGLTSTGVNFHRLVTAVGFTQTGCTTDVAPATWTMTAQAAWSSAATNLIGATFKVQGGIGKGLGTGGFVSCTGGTGTGTGGGATLSGGQSQDGLGIAASWLAGGAVQGTSTTGMMVGTFSTIGMVSGASNASWGWLSASPSVAGSGTITLTNVQYNCPVLLLTGALTGAVTLVFPNQPGFWLVDLGAITGVSATNTLSFKAGTTTTTVINTTTIPSGTDRMCVVVTNGSNVLLILGGNATTIP